MTKDTKKELKKPVKKKERRYLVKKKQTKRRQDYMDNIQYVKGVKDNKGIEVIRALNEEEQDWLNQFNKEYYNASRDGAVLHTENDDWVGEGGLYEANNARNRCVLNIGKATNTLDFISMGTYDQNTIKAFEGRDMDLLVAYNAGLVRDLKTEPDKKTKKPVRKKKSKKVE